jgi:hypothetical protein
MTIYVHLLNEGVDVWRPVEAAPAASDARFRIVTPCPEEEDWEFQPGDVVRCEMRTLSGGPCLVAVERVEHAISRPQ